MNYLAIDTSGKALILALSLNGKIYKYVDNECGVRHSVSIMTETEKLLGGANAKICDLDFLAVVVGAGSFTGIRIGVATVKALAFANGKPCLSTTSFDTIAYNKTEGKVLAVLDAGHDGYYACGYLNGTVILQPSYILKDELISLSREYTVLGIEKLRAVDNEIVSVVDGLICAINNKRSEVDDDLDKIIPLYVRKSQAEEGR